MGYVKISNKKDPWARKSSIHRNARTELPIKNTFLIFCEGKNTEPEYFRSFPVTSDTQVEAIGLGRSRKALVEKIVDLCQEKEYLMNQKKHDPERQIWCVFDKDTKGEKQEDKDFNDAINLARKKGLNVAYSNDSFELWFYLHFEYIDSKVIRDHYYTVLKAKLGINYKKVGKKLDFCKTLYSQLLPHQEVAIKRASKLVKFHNSKQTDCQRNPVTLVHELVQKLNQHLRK